MALPSNGYVEINDTNSIIRGTMAGANGTFSGVFSSQNVNVVENINIRDGAVTAFYGFNFPRGSSRIVIAVPKQPFAQFLDIMLPIEVYEYGAPAGGATITVYKNGVLFMQQSITPTIGYTTEKMSQSEWQNSYTAVHYRFAWYLQTARIMDFNVTAAATYDIRFTNGVLTNHTIVDGYGKYATWAAGYSLITFQGQATVGFRKR